MEDWRSLTDNRTASHKTHHQTHPNVYDEEYGHRREEDEWPQLQQGHGNEGWNHERGHNSRPSRDNYKFGQWKRREDERHYNDIGFFSQHRGRHNNDATVTKALGLSDISKGMIVTGNAKTAGLEIEEKTRGTAGLLITTDGQKKATSGETTTEVDGTTTTDATTHQRHPASLCGTRTVTLPRGGQVSATVLNHEDD